MDARLLVVTAALTLATGSVAACASGGAANTKTRQEASSRDKVSREEIEATPASSAYDLIYHVRPDWLRRRGTASMIGASQGTSGPLVYLDGVKLGGLDALRSINARDIQSIEWVPGSKAPMVLSDVGSGAIVGAILLRSR